MAFLPRSLAIIWAFFIILALGAPAYASDDMPIASPADLQPSTPSNTVPVNAVPVAPSDTDLQGAPLATTNKVTAGINYSLSKLTARKYPLGPNDVISISVMGMPDLSHDRIRIQPDGYIILDIVGPLYVTGLTMTDLYKLLEEKYAKYYNNPKLSIDLVETKPFLVYITGAVLSPGSYEVYTNPSIRQVVDAAHPDITVNRTTPFLTSVLTASGGLSANADLQNILIRNQYTGESFNVDLLNLLQTGDSAQDIYLIPGDSVIVSKLSQPISPQSYQLYASASFSPKTIPIKVYGYVNNPGLVTLPTATSMDLLSAITAAGGYLKEAAYSPKTVYIFRRVDAQGTLKKIALNPTERNTPLLPNDIVYVPEKPIPRVGKFFDYMARLAAPFYLGANAYFDSTGKFLFKQ